MRLINVMRVKIVNKALHETFYAREAALDVRENALALRCYDNVVSKYVRGVLDQLPSQWKAAASTLRFNVNGKRIALCLEDSTGAKPVPYHYWNNPNYAEIGAVGGVDLCAAVEAWLDDTEALKAEREAARLKLRVLLDSVHTVEKLAEVWPEGKAFYADVTPVTKNLPAVQVSDINAMLGLPRGEK